jgi:hypothetical protein
MQENAPTAIWYFKHFLGEYPRNPAKTGGKEKDRLWQKQEERTGHMMGAKRGSSRVGREKYGKDR